MFTRISAGIAAVAAAAAPMLLVDDAFAAERDGVCDEGEFCLYYNSDHQGAVSDFTGSISNYGDSQPQCYEYKGQGNGSGKCVKNDAAAAWNRTDKPVTLYVNSNHGGGTQTFKPGAKVNLSKELKNNNASHRIGDDQSNPGGAMSEALYAGGGGRLTTGFDGYENTPGRHEGIDFAKGSGAEVRSLLGGTVILSEGGSGLTTVSVYNEEADKTQIYLHTNPKVKTGDVVQRGQVIATESDKGSPGSVHTHVELRDGRKERAAKSVNDPNLDNANPYPFWKSQGYSIG